MDVRDEMSLSKDDPSPKSSSLRVSDQNKHRNKLIGVKDKPQVGSLSPRKWRTRDMIVTATHGDKVLNVQSVSEFNPTIGIQVLKPLVKDKPLVKKPLVVEKPVTVVVKDKATVKNPAVVATVKKPANVVEKPAVLVKEKDKDKVQVSIVKENDVVPDVGLEKVISNDKDLSNFVSNKRRRRTELPKLNAPTDVADKESDVVNNKDKESDVADKELDVDKDKFGANELLSDVVSKKRRHRTELPKVNASTVMADKPLVKKSIVKAAVKPAVKRIVKAAVKPAAKGNESKKLKSKSSMKRKIKNSSDSLSSSVDEKGLRRLLKKLKYVKQEDSDESVLDRKMKYKKNEKELTPSEVAHEEYLKNFPTLRFNSFHNLAIDEIPSRVGRFCVANFNSYTYKLFLDSGDSIHVTPSKIHDILGIPVGGISLFSLEARPVEHEFVKSVAGLKGEICLDVVRRLREDSDISKIDWCGYIHTIRAWNSTLMRQREKLELKELVLGLLELHDESTGGGSMLTSEKEYAEVFKNPIEFGYDESSLGDDGNGDDDTGNGDDDNMNGDDDIGIGDDNGIVNEDDYDNVYGNDSSVTDKEVHVVDDGNRV
ncbi:hypothetical protein Tco_0501655, partial [Tanacetum coccineum]